MPDYFTRRDGLQCMAAQYGKAGLLALKQHLTVEVGNVQTSRAALQFIQPVEQIVPRGGEILDVGAGQNPQ